MKLKRKTILFYLKSVVNVVDARSIQKLKNSRWPVNDHQTESFTILDENFRISIILYL